MNKEKHINIELVRLTHEYKSQLTDMLTEWKADIEKNHNGGILENEVDEDGELVQRYWISLC